MEPPRVGESGRHAYTNVVVQNNLHAWRHWGQRRRACGRIVAARRQNRQENGSNGAGFCPESLHSCLQGAGITSPACDVSASYAIERLRRPLRFRGSGGRRMPHNRPFSNCRCRQTRRWGEDCATQRSSPPRPMPQNGHLDRTPCRGTEYAVFGAGFDLIRPDREGPLGLRRILPCHT